MSVWSRSLIVTATGVMLAGVVGCSSDGPAGNASEESSEASSSSSSEMSDLSSVAPCDLLKPEALETVGLSGPGKPNDTISWEPGCEYQNDSITLSVYANFRQTVASAERDSSWASFEKADVNGRAAATAITEGSTQARVCNALFNAGGGMMKVAVGDNEDSLDECAKALEIAKKVEPNVPEPA